MSEAGKVGEDYPIAFAVQNGDGSPRTGLSGFTVTVRKLPAGGTNNPAVTETANGEYTFTIPAAFTTAELAGNYGVNVQQGTTPIALGESTVVFKDADIDDVAVPGDAMALTAGAIDAIWDELQAGHVTPASMGFALAVLQGAKIAYVLDGGPTAVDATKVDLDSQGLMTAGRIRIFLTAAAADAATLGAANGADSELVNIDIAATAAVAGRLENMEMID